MPGKCLGQLHIFAQCGDALRVRIRGLLKLGELTPSLGGELEQDRVDPDPSVRALQGEGRC